jgi:hypothetical protein
MSQQYINVVSWNVAGEPMQLLAFMTADDAWKFKETLSYCVMDVQTHEVPLVEV